MRRIALMGILAGLAAGIILVFGAGHGVQFSTPIREYRLNNDGTINSTAVPPVETNYDSINVRIKVDASDALAGGTISIKCGGVCTQSGNGVLTKTANGVSTTIKYTHAPFGTYPIYLNGKDTGGKLTINKTG